MSLIERLDYDTDLIGAPVGRIVRRTLRARAAARLKREIASSDYRCLYLELPLGDPKSINRGIALGFKYVSTRIFLSREVTAADGRRGRVPAGFSLASGEPSDYAGLVPLADELVKVSRFWADEKFQPALARKLYRDWVRKSLDGTKAFASFVLRDIEGRPVGLITLSDKGGAGDASGAGDAKGAGDANDAGDAGDLTLVGLLKEYTGRGLGAGLIRRALADLARRGYARATVSTQGENVNALRAYEEAGFRAFDAGIVLHRWSA